MALAGRELRERRWGDLLQPALPGGALLTNLPEKNHMRKNHFPTATLVVASAAAALSVHCSSSSDPSMSTQEDIAASAEPQMEECLNDDGSLLGLLPVDPSLTPAQRRGRCTWVLY